MSVEGGMAVIREIRKNRAVIARIYWGRSVMP